jgi:hypothetical protein
MQRSIRDDEVVLIAQQCEILNGEVRIAEEQELCLAETKQVSQFHRLIDDDGFFAGGILPRETVSESVPQR